MVIGVCQVSLFLYDKRSLKEKRKTLKSIVGKVRSKFPVSIAEVGDNDLWQKAQLGMCIVGSDKKVVNSSLDKVINYIEGLQLAEIIETHIEIMTV